MEDRNTLQARCTACVAELNNRQHWHLTTDQQAAYTAAIVRLLPAQCDDALLAQIVSFYHHDHEQVAILRDTEHPQHDALWAKWRVDVIRVIQHRHFAQGEHSLASLDELAQTALESFHQALPFFGFRSQFSTWVYAIIARSIQRYLKMLGAAKRGKDNAPLDQSTEAYTQTIDADQPEDQVAGELLRQLIYEVLEGHADNRLARIFNLWAAEDQRITDIGTLVGLSAGRVSVLIRQAQEILQQNPSILQWLKDQEPPDDDSSGKQ